MVGENDPAEHHRKRAKLSNDEPGEPDGKRLTSSPISRGLHVTQNEEPTEQDGPSVDSRRPPNDNDDSDPVDTKDHETETETEACSSPDVPYKVIRSAGLVYPDGCCELLICFVAKDTQFQVRMEYKKLPPDYKLTDGADLIERCVFLHDKHRWQELVDTLMPFLQPIFKEHTPPRTLDLDAHLRSSQVNLRLEIHDHPELFVGLLDMPRVPAVFKEMAEVPRFELSQVESFRTIQANKVFEVRIQGKAFLYKTTTVGTGILEDEALRLREIAARCPASLRVPRLEGFLGLGSPFPGILLTFVPSTTLGSMINIETEVALAERRKWFDQLHEMVSSLHQGGCIWGDVKPDNVLIDHNRDVWLVDFENGLTPGWVPIELMGTKAGDLEGLSNVRRKFLQLPN
ncbi:uncharacterized protein BO66DRAFT_458265 [Aspergillus aculeatinus CBS 121060]|uniref:Uncharacterized protein n=1 Tax=Aspergillus aculeatinus CBS 121060 TaxID=1448322 RepID=A0ACD1H187_9EURO|nr:hypothetical protein BO66DRAFT_458265 [Aspergillus aculeatinus CBS 121060]RAH67342.1 hypothetical protein BO66DRAFT_458265 [Aspergillus aculeatinus CBS 121060]